MSLSLKHTFCSTVKWGNNAKSVSLNGKSLKLADNGLFVFGFGRDAKPVHTLSWVDKTGKGQIGRAHV